ncbi:hypothetical protein KIL84_013683 [Mauremys mutica]|uniref:Uncharacterized protein n=1 Tax=Mauremys mutica TaxID=74926 RepID=A0A9D4ASC3_9SAUR|nr:hypothetical protein KIL84_013683 [Mauremys mutica]
MEVPGMLSAPLMSQRGLLEVSFRLMKCSVSKAIVHCTQCACMLQKDMYYCSIVDVSRSKGANTASCPERVILKTRTIGAHLHTGHSLHYVNIESPWYLHCNSCSI